MYLKAFSMYHARTIMYRYVPYISALLQKILRYFLSGNFWLSLWVWVPYTVWSILSSHTLLTLNMPKNQTNWILILLYTSCRFRAQANTRLWTWVSTWRDRPRWRSNIVLSSHSQTDYPVPGTTTWKRWVGSQKTLVYDTFKITQKYT